MTASYALSDSSFSLISLPTRHHYQHQMGLSLLKVALIVLSSL